MSPRSHSLVVESYPLRETGIEIQEARKRCTSSMNTTSALYDSTGIDDVSMGAHCGPPLLLLLLDNRRNRGSRTGNDCGDLSVDTISKWNLAPPLSRRLARVS